MCFAVSCFQKPVQIYKLFSNFERVCQKKCIFVAEKPFCNEGVNGS